MSTNIVVLLALPTEHDVFKQHFPVLSGRDVSTGSLVRLEHYIEHDGFTLTRAKTHNHHMMAAARWMLPRKLAASLS